LYVGTATLTEVIRINPDDTWDLVVGTEMDPRSGTTCVGSLVGSLAAPSSFYHAAKGCVFCCCCGHVGNANALSIMSTVLSLAICSRQTAIGAR
jgi:hypothetical protein